MTDKNGDPRAVSHDLFGNSAFVEVAESADRILYADGAGGTVTTRQVAAATGSSDSVVRPVMLRLTAVGLLVALPKTGAANGPQPYARGDAEAWTALRVLLGRLAGMPPGVAAS